jgi:hypothetical protein
MDSLNEQQPDQLSQLNALLLPQPTPPPNNPAPAPPAGTFTITLWDGKPYRLSASHFYTISMPIVAILCTYFGAAQRANHTPESEALQHQHYKDRTIDEVSKWWGKGEFLSWLLTVNALQLDILLDRRTCQDVPRWIAVLGYSISALVVQIWLALRSDFGPNYDAARYVSDKGFQALAIIYFLAFAKTYLRHVRPDEGLAPPAIQRNTPPKYRIWPCYVLAAFWVAARGLANGHVVYVSPPSHVVGSRLWAPPIPAKFAPLVAVGGFLVTLLCLYPRAPGTAHQKIVSGLPAGVWFGFVLNHVGLCNSPRALALATSEWSDLGTIVPLSLAGLTFIYGVVDPGGKWAILLFKGCGSAVVAVQQATLPSSPAGYDGSYEMREEDARAGEAGGVDHRELPQEQDVFSGTIERDAVHELQEVDIRVNEADGSNINELQGEVDRPIEADGTALYELASDSPFDSEVSSSSISEE